MCSMYRTLVNFSLPRACPGRPLGRGPENPILEAFQNSYNPFILSLYGSLILGSGGYGTTLGGSGPPPCLSLGLGLGVNPYGGWWPGCLAGRAAWLAWLVWLAWLPGWPGSGEC